MRGARFIPFDCATAPAAWVIRSGQRRSARHQSACIRLGKSVPASAFSRLNHGDHEEPRRHTEPCDDTDRAERQSIVATKRNRGNAPNGRHAPKLRVPPWFSVFSVVKPSYRDPNSKRWNTNVRPGHGPHPQKCEFARRAGPSKRNAICRPPGNPAPMPDHHRLPNRNGPFKHNPREPP